LGKTFHDGAKRGGEGVFTNLFGKGISVRAQEKV